MRNKFFFILVLVLSFSLLNASAQNLPDEPKKIFGGVLNSKATSLPKPSYPAAAKAVYADGVVNVRVEIDENGNIVSATAITGHPLLRQASEQAARAAKFSPTQLEGQTVRVTGILIYNFVLPITFAEVGFDLSLAEKSKTIDKFTISSISGSFPNDWKEEKNVLRNLNMYLFDELQKNKSLKAPAPMDYSCADSDSPKVVTGVPPTSSSNIHYSLDESSVNIIKELRSKIKSRLSINEEVLWTFRFGSILGKLQAEVESDEKTRANILELNIFKETSPKIPDLVSSQIEEVLEFPLEKMTTAERIEKLLPLVESLRKLRAF